MFLRVELGQIYKFQDMRFEKRTFSKYAKGEKLDR